MLPENDLRGRLPDLYFVNATSAQLEHHSSLLARLPQEKRIIEFMHPPGTFLTELALCAYDDERPGLLAKICGTLAALKVRVHTASVFTLRHDKAIILDTLQISDAYLGHDRCLSAAKQNEIRAAMEKLLDGDLSVGQSLKRPLWSRALQVQEIKVEDEPQKSQKAITIRTSKNALAVFLMAAAMASLGLDIQAAQIHQSEKQVQGVFFVTGNTRENLDYQLRFELQSNALPNVFR